MNIENAGGIANRAAQRADEWFCFMTLELGSQRNNGRKISGVEILHTLSGPNFS